MSPIHLESYESAFWFHCEISLDQIVKDHHISVLKEDSRICCDVGSQHRWQLVNYLLIILECILSLTFSPTLQRTESSPSALKLMYLSPNPVP